MPGYQAPVQRPPRAAGSRRAMWIAIGAGLFLATVVLILLIALTDDGVVPRGRFSPEGPVPSPGRPGADGAIPIEGTDVHLAGGVASVPVPEGWDVLARADARTGPGGHPEAAVLRHRSGVTFTAYAAAPDPESAQDAAAAADEHARAWTADGEQVVVDPVQGAPASGSITAAATVRYRYTLRGRALAGELYHGVRQDGWGLFVFVDVPGAPVEEAVALWGPLRDAVILTFAA